MKSILNKIGKILLIIITGILILNLYIQVRKLEITVQETVEHLQYRIDNLYSQTAKLINNYYVLLGNITKDKTELKKQLNTMQDLIKDVDIQYILNGNVIVSGLEGSGAGTIIKKTDTEMYILTCYHVVNDIIELNEIGVPIGVIIGYVKLDYNYNVVGKILYGAEVIKYDKEVDLALLKTNISDNELVEIKIAELEPEKGDILYSIGTPLGLPRTISKGILANYYENYYIFDGTTTFGNSGGGLYNIRGELVGVPAQVFVYAKEIPESGLGMAINLKVIKEFLKNTK
jgi:S1-C subfamily serine protease